MSYDSWKTREDDPWENADFPPEQYWHNFYGGFDEEEALAREDELARAEAEWQWQDRERNR